MGIRNQLLYRAAQSARLTNWASRTRAVAKRRISPYVDDYVAGPTREHAIATARQLAQDGILSSLIIVGEATTNPAALQALAQEYALLVKDLPALPGQHYVACDLSNLGLDVSEETCLSILTNIGTLLPGGARIELSQEDAPRIDRAMTVITSAVAAGIPLVITLRANLPRSFADLPSILALNQPIRVVKGAYRERETLPFGGETDAAFVALVDAIALGGGIPIAATHDRVLIETLLTRHPALAIEMLFGVKTEDARELAREGRAVRVEVPYGSAWLRFGLRRRAERGRTRAT